jgi:hypothetical protein
MMRDVSRRAFEMNLLSGGYVWRVRREVRLVIVDECGVHALLMTMGRMSGQCSRMALARGVYLARIKWAMWERLWSVQYFHSPI